MEYHSGDIIKVTVTNIENYGIFVKVDEKHSGLIHISEVSKRFITNIRKYAFIGETIYAKVVDIDEERQQFRLSIKSIDYRMTNKKGNFVESPNGFLKLKEMLPIWIDRKMREIS